jgi:RimJ/RimL family protein N-acetyltransferase
MSIEVRPMSLEETKVIIDYFHSATPEHLEMLGVDPTRLPPPAMWRERYAREHTTPTERRTAFMVSWLEEGRLIGFSTTDRIAFGERANMHLHIVASENRKRGAGAQCVRKSVEIYFDTLKLKRLYCEPNAFNVAPNRTLQKAGFKYVKTHMTVPGPLNFHQAVNQWVIERQLQLSA